MTDRAARRRRAKQLMDGVAVGCVTIALAIGTEQLVKEGIQQFLYRPPGVGASPSEVASSGANAAAQPPQAAQVVPPAPTPSPETPERQLHKHDGRPYR